jgi:hypothetical protein
VDGPRERLRADGRRERWNPRKRWDYALASTVGGASPGG